MEKISGLVLDAHDDVTGYIAKGIWPELSDVPDLVKTAAAITPEQREALPDDVFALVLRHGDVTMRKYACVDAGNVALNIAYFLSSYNKLPVEAIKTAAANLETACHWYDIEPPEELKKLSTGNIPVIGKQQVWKDMDGTTYSKNDQSWDLEKNAEVSGSYDQPKQVTKEKVDPTRGRKSAVKTAEEQFEESLAGETLERGQDMPTEDQPKSLPQVKKTLTPHVDVSSHEPPKLITKKEASRFAMPSIQRYPLDGFDQVKMASAYFDEQCRFMDPPDRREFAHNLVKRASELELPVSEIARNYGENEGYAKEAQLIMAIDQRATLLKAHADQDFEEGVKTASAYVLGLYDQLFNQRQQMPAEVWAGAMHEIDKLAGLDEFYGTELDDPWLATFSKLAEEANPKDTVVIGNEYMTVEDLENYAQRGGEPLEGRFGEDFVKEFQADPKGIFDSLPVDQKKVIMRMVNNGHSVIQGASAS
jgi:hypothetical protein